MFTWKKRRGAASYFLIGLLMAAIVVIGGCGQANSDDQRQAGTQLSGTLNIAGSTSVQPFSEVLAEEFMSRHSGVQVNVQGGGSTQGITAAVSGAADIGAASRELKDEEIAQGVIGYAIALDGIGVVVNPANKVEGLTAEQVKNIYLGNIKNWKDVGGKDAPITVVTREESSGTRDAFLNIIMGKENIINSAIVQNSTGAVRTTVSGDRNAIGYISLATVTDEVKLLNIDGVAASIENVKNGSYKLQRPFNYVTKGEADSLAKAFIDFVLSDEGQKIIEEEGAFSIK
ncbi:phosphate ABC transporter substrate-binding protein [Syntrophomonas erecta]